MNLDKAVQFIKDNGDEIEHARLNYILTQERPTKEIISSLFRQQRQDGGWTPFWVEDYSSLDATCFRLAQAEQLGISQSETAVRLAVGFLFWRQSYNGSWEEERSVADSSPPWVKPGDLPARLYVTSNCVFWLSLMGNPGDGAEKAALFLQNYVDQDGRLPGFWHTH